MNITAPGIRLNKCLNKCKATWSTLLVILVLLLPKTLLADTITVSSIADLQTAINKAKPGDQLMLTDGVIQLQKISLLIIKVLRRSL